MFCSSCGTENTETSSFCSVCGTGINDAVALNPKKKSKKVFWILGIILAIILLFCVAPLGYGYVKLNSIQTFTPLPTRTPRSTNTPVPTKDPIVVDYLKRQAEIASKELSITEEINIIMSNASSSQTSDPTWKNNLYAKFDELVALAEEAANIPYPLGWENAVEELRLIHEEFVLAREDIIYSVENKDMDSLNDQVTHINLAGTHMTQFVRLIEIMGYKDY